MPTYILKTTARYEFDADSHEEALKIYQEGLWNYDDMTDEDAFELLHIDDKLIYVEDYLMQDSSFTPDVIYALKHLPDTLEGLKHLVDILGSFAYHDEPLTTQDMSNMFAIIGMISGKVRNIMDDDTHVGD